MGSSDGDHDNNNSNRETNISGKGVDTMEAGLPDEKLTDRINSLEQMLEDKNNSYNDLYERYLRIAADFDNYKKRITKEKNDLVAYGNEELIKALLNVIDNLERALKHKESERTNKSLIEGVDLVYKQFLSILEKFGLERINADKGSKFDPNYHQAVEHIESQDITPGLVVNEMIKGYLLKERLLRPSMVAVSKGLKKTLLTDDADTKKEVKSDKNEEVKSDTKEQTDDNEQLSLDTEKMFEIDDSEVIPDNSFNEDSLNINIDINDTNGDNSSVDDEIVDLLEEDTEEKQ